jgi:hypothetical protein
MIEHSPKTIGKFRCFIFPKGAKLENWRRDPATGVMLPEVPPEFDSGWCGNLVVNTGKALTQARAFGTAGVPAAISATGVGNDGPPNVLPTPVAVGNTQLAVLGPPAVLLAFDATPTLVGNVITCQTTFPGGSTTFQWNEAGMFNGLVNGTSVMLDRVTGFGSPTPGGAAAIAAWTYTQL